MAATAKKYNFKVICRGLLGLNFQGAYSDKWANSGGKITLSEEEYEYAKMNFPQVLATKLEPIGFKLDKDIEIPEFTPSYYFEVCDEKREDLLNKMKLTELEELVSYAEVLQMNDVTLDVIKTKLLLAKAGK